MVKYNKGDRIQIVGGVFKQHQYGIFLGMSGSSMCYVNVERDSVRFQRRLRLSSIAPIEQEADREHKRTAEEDMLDQLLIDLAKIRLASTAMEKKITKLKERQEQHSREE